MKTVFCPRGARALDEFIPVKNEASRNGKGVSGRPSEPSPQPPEGFKIAVV
jgi:hypothetical protein